MEPNISILCMRALNPESYGKKADFVALSYPLFRGQFVRCTSDYRIAEVDGS